MLDGAIGLYGQIDPVRRIAGDVRAFPSEPPAIEMVDQSQLSFVLGRGLQFD